MPADMTGAGICACARGRAKRTNEKAVSTHEMPRVRWLRRQYTPVHSFKLGRRGPAMRSGAPWGYRVASSMLTPLLSGVVMKACPVR